MKGLCKLVRNLPSGSDLKAEEIAQKLLDSWDAQNDGNLVKSACVINVLTSWSYTCEVFTVLIPISATLMVIHEVYFGNRRKPLKTSHMTLSTYILSGGHFVRKWDPHPDTHTWTEVWRNVSSWWHGGFQFMHQFCLHWEGSLPLKRDAQLK